ncbi:GNAT family N-acetyltransferase [Pseudoalteromonas fenneropenaei]|uniref:GNAT family N-acetyltransferase n=1 Tax=Pseudoalteromonas fenneropenaei TaxID=1737459 RepID=A0ABV7CI49_9GAMM
MRTEVQNFAQLNTDSLYELLKLRVTVFVVEQNCPYPELDDIDRAPDCLHLSLLQDDKLAGYARCYRKACGTAAIGRVVVAPWARGQGLAKKLMLEAINVCRKRYDGVEIVISAQTYLLDFYAGLGFIAEGEAYLEDGIPHQDMRLQ